MSPKFHNHAMIVPEAAVELSVKTAGLPVHAASALNEAIGAWPTTIVFRMVSLHPFRFVTINLTIFDP